MPVALTVLVGLIVAFALALDEDQAPPLFAEDLRGSLVDVGRSAAQFGALVEGINGADRVTLDTTVDDSLEALSAARMAMGEAPVGDPELAGPLAILDQVIASWETGVSSFRDLVFEAADDPLAVGLEIEITDALIDLRAGDRLYQSFVASMDQAETSAPVVPFPEIAFVSDTYPFSSGPAQIVGFARADGSELALRADLAIGRVATVPDMVVNTSDQAVVTVTDTLKVQVVVLNSGNTDSEPVDVMIDLVGNDGSTYNGVESTPGLGPGRETTVEFDGLTVTPGVTYQLTVRLPLIDGDDASEDNLQDVTFVVNEATESTTTTSG